MLGQGYLVTSGRILIMLNLKREGIGASVPSVPHPLACPGALAPCPPEFPGMLALIRSPSR